ncbi:glycosyltransferase family 39 protein [Frigoribacterium sp. CFBP 13707]|uniref:ArnT family glycosyltransferase n=1 Tax=Frigoribacterium sp. CFBP 13707 TaxID=2775313 RepID=UPI0017820631|nr:glycosyltransferase [Frigoribacterium sp. CFBP 13707]MBD8726409.1 glycosyltransferase [Frigoribacterium sp. CFBP 13707]
MTATIERPAAPVRPAVPRVHEPAPGRGRTPVGEWFRRHGRSLAWLLPVLAIAATVQAWNMAGSPQRIDDEGTYTAQAWAVQHLGELTHYTYWYDHPPVGWLQIAAYTSLTGAFSRYDIAVLAAREAVLAFTLVAVVLVWLFGRKLGLSRPAAAVAALVFAVSPLALQFHRTVYLDNIATPWLLAAFVFALSRRYQLAGYAAASLTFGIAVLSKETYLLALPFLAWTMWRGADRSTRRYTLSIAASLLVLVGLGYVALAAVKGELLPGAGRVSLLEGVQFQLATREASGSVFDTGSLFFATVSQWWQLDPVLIVLGVVAAVVGLFLRRVRPIAVMLVFLVAFMFRPGGYLPVPYVIMLLPFAALLIAAATDDAVRAVRARRAGRASTVAARTGAVAWLAVTAVAVVAVVPLWAVQLRGFVDADLDAPMRNAETWVEQNVPTDSRLLVDDAVWVDLVNAGFARENVIWFYKIDTDGAVQAQSPNGWRDSDYLFETESVRTSGLASADVRQALESSTVVASFGEGDQQVAVRRIDRDGAAEAQRTADEAAAARSRAGSELAQNPGLQVSSTFDQALTDGRLDPRAVIVLGQLAAIAPVSVADPEGLPGEQESLFRQFVVTPGGGESLTDLRATLEGLGDVYAPQSVEQEGDALRVTFSAVPPEGLLAP